MRSAGRWAVAAWVAILAVSGPMIGDITAFPEATNDALRLADLREQWERAVNRADLYGVVRHYGPGAVVLPAGDAPRLGHEAIGDWLAAWFSKADVHFAFESRKLRAGELGEETEMPIDERIDIGVFDADGEALYLEKHRIDRNRGEITVQVDGEPARAGIDPYHKLIDRHPDDNETRVEIES